MEPISVSVDVVRQLTLCVLLCQTLSEHVPSDFVPDGGDFVAFFGNSNNSLMSHIKKH